MKDLHEKLLAAFDVEHKDHLEAVRSMLDVYEEAEAEAGALDLVELHRRLHSLKGAARAVDLAAAEKLAHALEEFVEGWQVSATAMGPGALSALRRGLDAIEDVVATSLAGERPPSLDGLLDAIRKARAADTIPAREQPALAESREGAGGVDPTTTNGSETCNSQGAGEAADGQQPTPSGSALRPPVTTRVETRNFDAIVQCSSEIISGLGVQDEVLASIKSAQSEIAALGDGVRWWPAVSRQCDDEWRAPSDAETISDRLQRISELLRDAVRRQRDQAWRARRLGRNLQEQVGLLQTVSADGVFGGARKLVRDIAREQGKQVRVTVRGLDALADRAVLERLKDPVYHMLRNAIHHGIETPAERASLAKPEEGHVVLEIATRGSELIVTVEDDGRGVDRNRVLELARERGLVATVAGFENDDQALLDLLTRPGLSTAAAVTEVAGRGIGLSVVAEAVARLGGELWIAPAAPHGTRSTITVPASVLAMRFVLIESAGDICCIPASRVVRIHHLPKERIEMIDGRAHAVEPERPPMALGPLPDLLGRGCEGIPADASSLIVVELKSGGTRLGVIVDHVIAVHDGVMRNLDFNPARSACVAGGLVLETGAVVPVLDGAALIAAYRRIETPCVLPSQEAEAARRQQSILIVDDSITTRTLEQSVLESNGYHVRLSADGADALQQLRTHGADLVISDVEMPKVDGFGLLGAMKKEPELAGVPVILVTSRNDDIDRRRGLRLGASAYVVKQRFDQTELLKTIGRLL